MENLPGSEFLGFEPEVVQLDGDFFSTFQFLEGPVLGQGLSGIVVEASSITNPLAKVAVKKFSLLGSDGGLKKSRTFYKEVSFTWFTCLFMSLSHIVFVRGGHFALIIYL